MKIIRFIFNVIIYIAIVAGIVLGLPKFLSWKLGTSTPIAAITSGSMWPVLKEGDLVLIQKISKEDIKVGDIVIWQNEKGFTIHRVAKLNEDTLVTKGDANFTDDTPVSYEDIVGRAFKVGNWTVRIPYFGFISEIGGKVRDVPVPQ